MAVTLKPIEKKDFPLWEKLYAEAFPKMERIPYKILRRKAVKGVAECLGIYDGDTFVGFFYSMVQESFSYLVYFAVRSDIRGKGYGTQALTAYKELHKDEIIFLALEPEDEQAPNAEQRKRRHDFYERNGLKDMSRVIKEGPVVYETMSTGKYIEPRIYSDMMNHLVGRIYRLIIPMELR